MEEPLAVIPLGKHQSDIAEKPFFSPVPQIPFPEHGGDTQTLQSLCEAHSLLDFSVCLNPLGPPSSLAQTVLGAIHKIAAYPSPNALPLKEKLASHFELPAEHFLVTHGSTQLIHALPELWPVNRSVCIIAPCFSEYEKAFALKGIETHFFQLNPEKEFEHSWKKLVHFLDSIPNLGGVVLGHPTSPSGTVCSQEFLNDLLNFSKDKNCYLVVDETFVDFTDRGSFLPDTLQDHANLILVRTFTKFFSIPGIRLGYGMMSPYLQKRLEPFIPPWSIGSLEMEIGSKCLEEAVYINDTRTILETEKERILDCLNHLPSVRAFPSKSCSLLFQLVDSNITPETFYKELLQDGILIRNCGNFRGLDQHFFRAGIRTKDENSLLIKSLTKHLV